MSAFFMRPIPLTPAMISASFGPATAENIGDPQPKVVWATTSPAAAWGPVSLDIDLGDDSAIDTAALLYHTGVSGWWRLYAMTAAQGAFAAHPDTTGSTIIFPAAAWRTSPTIDTTRVHAVWAGTQFNARYLRFQIFCPDGTSPNWSAGVLAIGRRLEPPATFGLDWGGGRRVADLSNVRVLDGGERGIWKKARVPEIRGSFSHLTDAELRDWWRILNQIGESDPVLLVEDPATTIGQQERIHYGTLTGLDFWERRQSDKSRIDFRLTHWL